MSDCSGLKVSFYAAQMLECVTESIARKMTRALIIQVNGVKVKMSVNLWVCGERGYWKVRGCKQS